MLVNFSHLVDFWEKAIPVIQAIIVFVLLFFLFNFLLAVVRRKLLKKAVTKKQIHGVKMFTKGLRYILLGFLFILAFSVAFDSLQQFGITVGIFSAAVGLALQRPITGMAAWLMIIVRRPFEVGDRISIGNVRGNVKEITLTHIYLEEVGRYGGEELSGRTIIISNTKLFEENIINYSYDHEYVLGQVAFTVTNESNVDEAIRISLNVVKKYTDEFNKLLKKEAHYRLYFSVNGMEIRPRYYVPLYLAQETASRITKDIYSSIKAHNEIELANQEYNITARNMMPRSKK